MASKQDLVYPSDDDLTRGPVESTVGNDDVFIEVILVTSAIFILPVLKVNEPISNSVSRNLEGLAVSSLVDFTKN